MRNWSFHRAAFMVSVVALAFLYGIATQAFGWFPSSFLQRAWLQAEAVAPEAIGILPWAQPGFVSSRVYERTGVRVTEPDAVQPGLTLISGHVKDRDWKLGLKLIDREGQVLHRWIVDPRAVSETSDTLSAPPVNSDLHGSYIFPNGDLLVNIEYDGTIRLDACGVIKWRIARGNHHAISRAQDGSFWIPAVGGKADPPNEYPGLREASYYRDQIMRVSPEGQVLDKIDVIEILYANGLERYIAKKEQLKEADITHLNDIDPLPDSIADEYPLFEAGDLAVSLRNIDLVFVVDPDTWKVKWHASDPFIEQHDPDWVGDGWIGVFNNNVDGTARGTMLGGSEVVMLQPHTDSLRVRFPSEVSDPFYTSYKGEWQQLRNGNLLLTESSTGRAVEVDADGRAVWEWIEKSYEEDYVPEISKARRVDLTRAEVSKWPCSIDDRKSSSQG